VTVSERRRFFRKPIQIAVSVSTAERKDRVGCTRDLSAKGLLFHSASRFAVGERVDLMFRLARQGPLTTATARVVRAMRDRDQELFQHITAVEFDQPLVVSELDG